MSKESVRKNLDQVKNLLYAAEISYQVGEYDFVDEQLAALRDLLGDIYDRPEEDITQTINRGVG